LQQQLQQKMTRHVESMRSQRELSQISIQQLQDKLKNLEKVCFNDILVFILVSFCLYPHKTLSSSENHIYRKKFSSQMPPNKDPETLSNPTDPSDRKSSEGESSSSSEERGAAKRLVSGTASLSLELEFLWTRNLPRCLHWTPVRRPALRPQSPTHLSERTLHIDTALSETKGYNHQIEPKRKSHDVPSVILAFLVIECYKLFIYKCIFYL
jgi:hypothetical protein